MASYFNPTTIFTVFQNYSNIWWASSQLRESSFHPRTKQHVIQMTQLQSQITDQEICDPDWIKEKTEKCSIVSCSQRQSKNTVNVKNKIKKVHDQ